MPKDMQTEQLLCWSGMTDTEHSKTSSLNKEEWPEGYCTCWSAGVSHLFHISVWQIWHSC